MQKVLSNFARKRLCNQWALIFQQVTTKEWFYKKGEMSDFYYVWTAISQQVTNNE